jgi:dTDP-4-amino-4,6-dideoxygalactose transaminase
MHNLGHPARAEQIKEICSRFNVHVVEDAAESLGSYEGNKHTGRIGELGTLSFNGNKVITTGGGGAVITDDKNLADTVRHLTTTAKKPHPWLFLHDRVGFNYRMPNLNAALGCAQIKRLDKFLLLKRDLAAAYTDWFARYPESFFCERSNTRANYWLNAILLGDRVSRDEFLGYTNEKGIMTRPMWTPMHTLPMFADGAIGSLKNTESIESRLVCIPSGVPAL